MASEFKTCPTCKRSLLRAENYYFRSNGNKGYRWESYCKDCMAAKRAKGTKEYERLLKSNKRWRERNIEHLKQYKKEYDIKHYKEHTETIKKRVAEYRDNNKEAVLMRERKRITYLSDGYVAQVLGFKTNECLNELIELKRQQMQLRRLTNKLEKEIENAE